MMLGSLSRASSKHAELPAENDAPAGSAERRAALPESIAILIGQLGQGGSERQLFSFLADCDRSRWSPTVYVSGALGHWEPAVRQLGIPIVLLQGSPVAKMLRFRRLCRASGVRCFFSWSSYTNGFGLALVGCPIRRIGSFRNALFADLPERGRRLWTWLSLTGADAFVCNSAQAAAALERRVPACKQIRLIPNVVELFPVERNERWRENWRDRLGIGEDEVLVLGVGRLAPQKNFARFVRTVAAVGREIPVVAVIAGHDMGCLADLRALVARMGLNDRVRLIGGVADAREIIAAADIFLLTSDFEGTPNVILEAMAAGVPCVATAIDGNLGCIEDGVTGFLADCDDEALAAPVRRLSQDPRLRLQMGSRARAAIASRPRAEQIVRELWSLCEGSPRR